MIEAQLAPHVDVDHAAHALAQHEHRLVQHRQQYAVDDEARRIERLHHRLADPARKALDRRDRFGRGGQAANDLYQHHHRHGVEEMHADKAPRIRRGLRQAGDGNGRCVGRQDRVSGQQRPDIGEDRALDLLALGRRLDHQLSARQRRDLAYRGDPRDRLIRIALSYLALLHAFGEQANDAVAALLRARQVDVRQDHLIPRLRRNLRDPRAHLPSADHTYRLNIRHPGLLPHSDSRPLPSLRAVRGPEACARQKAQATKCATSARNRRFRLCLNGAPWLKAAHARFRPDAHAGDRTLCRCRASLPAAYLF